MQNSTIKELSVIIAQAAKDEAAAALMAEHCETVGRLYKAIMKKQEQAQSPEMLLLASAVLDAKFALEDALQIAKHMRDYPELTAEESVPFSKGAD